MPGYIIHLTEAKMVYDILKKNSEIKRKNMNQGQEEFFYGCLLPDAGGQKQSSHFWNKAESNLVIRLPDINRFLSKYADVIRQSPLYGGYLAHLHLDREFWDFYIKDQVEFLDINDEQTEYIQNLKNVLIERTGRKLSPEEFFSKNYLYGDYTRLNKMLIQKYGLSLMVPVYNECYNNRIKESDNEDMQHILEKLKTYISENSICGTAELTTLSLDTLEVFLQQTAQQFVELYCTYLV